MGQAPAPSAAQQPCSTSPSAPTESKEQLELRIAAALACPCVQGLKDGPCAATFLTAFTCFHRSRALPKGCDCLRANLAFADCLRMHPHVADDLRDAKDGGAFGGGQQQQKSGGG